MSETADIRMVVCRHCGYDVDPALASDGMHPECKAESYKQNLR